MTALTTAQQNALLLLFKDFSTQYNANSLSKKIGITRAGAIKILHHLHTKGILIAKTYGKSTFYKINFADQYACSMMDMLLRSEAREKTKRWLWEFREFFPHVHALIIFGSAVKDYTNAHDIDLLIVLEQKKLAMVQELIKKHREISIKPIHAIWQSTSDIKTNLQKPDIVVVNALRFGYILSGYPNIIAAVRSAQQAHGIFAIPQAERR